MTIQRVLILRPDNLGDVVLFSGALRHLRRLYPEARITLVARRYALPFLERCPYVDDLLAWESIQDAVPAPRYRPAHEGWWARRMRHRARRRDRKEWRRFCRGFESDVLLLPVRSPTATMQYVVASIPAATKLGVSGDTENQTPRDDEAAAAVYTRRLPLPSDRRFAHELETTSEFVTFLGAPVTPDDVAPELWTDDQDRAFAKTAVPRMPGAITLGICPGRSETRRLYPPERYAAALARIGDSRHTAVLLGAPGEEPVCASVASSLRDQGFTGTVTDLCGRTSPRQLVEALRRVDVVVSLDSAALHIAAALGKPVVGVRGGGQWGRFWPWGDPARSRTAAREMDCYGCNWVCRHDTVRCVLDIPVETLTARIEEAIACLPASFEA